MPNMFNKINEIDEEFFKKLEQSENMRKLFPAQDFVNGLMWYAFKLNQEVYLINSSGQNPFPINDKEELQKYHLEPTTYLVDTCNFSPTGVKRFLRGEKVDCSSLFYQIMGHIVDYVYLDDENYYVLLSLWIMATYFYRCYNNFPYLLLEAPRNSGKSTLMRVLKDLAFNGTLTSSISAPALFRSVDVDGATMFIDEFEQDKHKNSDLMNVLRSGYYKEGTYTICTASGKNDWRKKQYCTYSPKVLAGIDKIRESALVSRCIKIPIKRKPENINLSDYINCDDLENFIMEIRDNLYILGLQNGSIVNDLYLNRRILESYPLDNRDKDLWLPILITASLIDDDLVRNMYKLALETSGQSEPQYQDAWIGELINGLKEIVAYLPPDDEKGKLKKYSTQTLFEALPFYVEGMGQHITSTTKLTQVLNQIGMKQIRIGSDKKAWAFRPDSFKHLEI